MLWPEGCNQERLPLLRYQQSPFSLFFSLAILPFSPKRFFVVYPDKGKFIIFQGQPPAACHCHNVSLGNNLTGNSPPEPLSHVHYLMQYTCQPSLSFACPTESNGYVFLPMPSACRHEAEFRESGPVSRKNYLSSEGKITPISQARARRIPSKPATTCPT